MNAVLFIFGVIVLVVIVMIVYYNKFVAVRNKCDESWSGIDVQLKRRYDLIPNLVETVKGYASHEKDTLENVIKARNMAVNASGVEAQAQAENFLTGALKSIFALSEAYPELKANEGFLGLQGSLQEIENDIQFARRYYNAVVRDNNTMVDAFPSLIIANMFQFGKREYFEIDEASRENVQVKF